MGYIYKTTNLVNGKKYIGQSSYSSNKTEGYLGSGIRLRYAIKKYGADNFKKEIIVEGDFNKALLNELEKHYIQLHAAVKKDDYYNILNGGRGKKPEKRASSSKVIFAFDIIQNTVQCFSTVTKASMFFDTETSHVSSIAKVGGIIKGTHQLSYSLDRPDKTLITNSKGRIKTSSAKPIYEYSYTGNLLHTYSHFSEVCEKYGIIIGALRANTDKDSFNMKSYSFFTQDKNKIKARSIPDIFQPIYEYSHVGELLNVYFGTEDTSNKTRVNVQAIRYCIRKNACCRETKTFFTKNINYIALRTIPNVVAIPVKLLKESQCFKFNTLRECAEYLKVSHSTVSRILHNLRKGSYSIERV